MDTEDKKPNEPGTLTQITHIDDQGQARMVDVGGKEATRREAIAEAIVTMSPETLRLVVEGQMKKGDVFGAARLAGIMAAKKTPELIPLCHPLPIDAVQVDVAVDEDASSIIIQDNRGNDSPDGGRDGSHGGGIGCRAYRLRYVQGSRKRHHDNRGSG